MDETPSAGGKPGSLLFHEVYDQLRALARRRLSDAPGERSLQATALVHEAYMRLMARPDARWNDEQHLMAAAAQVIRWILVDRARRRTAQRRGGGQRPQTLDEEKLSPGSDDQEILALDAALEDLRAESERKYEVVMLRYFGGLSVEETARSLEVSPATVKREWNFARAWLLVALRGSDETGRE